jgi:predicted dehydrogenase
VPLRAALIGYGLAGSVFHAPLIAATDGLELATVVTGNAERAEAARAAYPGIVVESSADAVFAWAEGHDLVVVATPNDTHVPLADRAIECGLPVVVDKPLAPSAAEARGLVERAEQAGVPLTVFHNRRWDSDFLTLRRLIAEDALGEVLRYESRFERWRAEPKPGWRQETAPERGGGLLLDLGAHLVDQALSLFGPARSVHGEVLHRRGGPADDDDFVAIEHDGGAISHLWMSELAAEPGPRLRVQGTRGAFVVEELDGQEDALRDGERPGTGEWGSVPEALWGRLTRADGGFEPVRPEPGDWPAFYEGVGAALAGDGPMPVDPRDAVAVLRVLEAARG